MIQAKASMPDCVKEYKLTFVDPLTPNVIHSKFFHSLVDCVYAIQTLKPQYNYMVWQYDDYDQDDGYTWELVDGFGSYKKYKYGMIISEYILGILMALVVLYLIIKK